MAAASFHNGTPTLDFERERRLVNVIIDEPQGSGNSIPSVWEVTNVQLALSRLHGRNHETWNIKDAGAASGRFNYDYSDDELAELADQINRIAALAGRTNVIFNNNWKDQGAAQCKNADEAAWRLGDRAAMTVNR